VAANAGVNSQSGTNMYYSVDEGLAHFIFWDSEAFWAQPADSQTAMVNWLKADLAAANANRAAVPWVIGLAHKTWWMDDTLQCPSGAGCVVWQLLSEGGVDFHVMGHIHYYARDLPEYPNAGKAIDPRPPQTSFERYGAAADFPHTPQPRLASPCSCGSLCLRK